VLDRRPYHSHLLERASHDLQSRSLSKGYAAPYGGTRDAVNAHLERVTSGPPSSRPPVVLITGPPHSGRSSCLAYFDRRSVRCGDFFSGPCPCFPFFHLSVGSFSLDFFPIFPSFPLFFSFASFCIHSPTFSIFIALLHSFFPPLYSCPPTPQL
jgi:hypothetical protein